MQVPYLAGELRSLLACTAWPKKKGTQTCVGKTRFPPPLARVWVAQFWVGPWPLSATSLPISPPPSHELTDPAFSPLPHPLRSKPPGSHTIMVSPGLSFCRSVSLLLVTAPLNSTTSSLQISSLPWGNTNGLRAHVVPRALAWAGLRDSAAVSCPVFSIPEPQGCSWFWDLSQLPLSLTPL